MLENNLLVIYFTQYCDCDSFKGPPVIYFSTSNKSILDPLYIFILIGSGSVKIKANEA